MLKNIVFQNKEVELNQGLELSLTSPREDSFILIGIGTTNGNGFKFKVHENALSKTYNSNSNGYLIPLEIGVGTKSIIQEKAKNIKSLKIFSKTYNFNVSILKSLNNLEELTICEDIVLDIKDIPRHVHSFRMDSGEIVGDYLVRNDFRYATMRSFILRNTINKGLPSSAVDNLLEDLSLANWSGTKRVEITGINDPRTSASDTFVQNLENKGVTVITNS